VYEMHRQRELRGGWESVLGSPFEGNPSHLLRGDRARADTSIVRVLSLRAVNTYYWSTRALAWGVDAVTGEEVTFTMSPRSAGDLATELENGGEPLLEVHELNVLFVGPSTSGTPSVISLGDPPFPAE
jgi:hypothetical protein